MSHLYYNTAHHPNVNMHPGFSSHSHHPHGMRSRRSGRYHNNNSQNSNKAYKSPRQTREAQQMAEIASFRKDFEAARSFDIEDDEVFCPFYLLTEDDLHSIHSSPSDRSSSSSGSPDASPLQHQLQPTPSFALSAAANPHVPSNPTYHNGNSSHLKIHQPLAQRTRNAIPIVDPNSRNTSPPNSVSPARQQQQQVNKAYAGRRWQ